jgi:dipeptidyl aminopeptidase/acylaminoacyl peptidase
MRTTFGMIPRRLVIVCLAGLLAALSGCLGHSATKSRLVVRMNPPSAIGGMAVSHDGRQLLLSIYREGPDRHVPRLRSEYRVVFASKKLQRLTESWDYFFPPILTQDDRAVLLMPRDPAQSLARVDLDSGAGKIVYRAPDPWRIGDGALCPDGERLAVAESREVSETESDGRVVLTTLTSAETKELWRQPGTLVSCLAWSPDQTRLLWAQVDLRAPYADNPLHLADMATGKILSFAVTCDELSPGCWAPDSRRFVAYSLRPGREGIYAVDAASGRADQLAQLSSREFAFTGGCPWSPTGRWIAFVSSTEGDAGRVQKIVVVSPDTRESRTLLGPLKEEITSLTWTPSGKSLYFVRGGSSLEAVTAP